MNKWTGIALMATALIVIGATIGTLASRTAQAQDNPAPLKIAVIDMAVAIKGCKIYEQLTNRAKENLEADWNEVISSLENDLKSAEARVKEITIDETKNDRDVQEASNRAKVIREQIKLAQEAKKSAEEAMAYQNTLKTIAAANIAVRQYAIAKRIDLVLKYVGLKEVPKESPEGEKQAVAQRSFRQLAQENIVLYSAKGRVDDISSGVRELLFAMDYDENRKAIDAEMGLDGK